MKPTKEQIEEAAKSMHEYARKVYARRGIHYSAWEDVHNNYKEGNRILARWHFRQLAKMKK
jgi:hypothetical protein